MNTIMTSFATNRKFYDDDHFPYGFDRSGEFTCRQATLLTERGYAYQELAAGRRKALTEQEKSFVRYCLGDKCAETEDEAVWGRYVALTRQIRRFYGVGINSHVIEQDEFSIDSDW